MEKHWFPSRSLFLTTDGPELQLKCSGQEGQLEQRRTCGFRINTVTAVDILTFLHVDYSEYLAEVNISGVKYQISYFLVVFDSIVCDFSTFSNVFFHFFPQLF